MSTNDREKVKDNLESLLDRSDIQTITNLLSEICFDKSDHVASTWQDNHLAGIWSFNGKLFDKLAGKLKETF